MALRRSGNLPTVATAREIVHFDDRPPPPGKSPWVPPYGPGSQVDVVKPNPIWPDQFARLAAVIAEALGDRALHIAHVGSTAVPGLPAKPVIDIDLTVANSREEATYVPALERLGFTLVVREPWWNEHRLLRGTDPAANLHVFASGNVELERHLIFRDWLREHQGDRADYAAAKRLASKRTSDHDGDAMDYNAGKEAVVRKIYAKAFVALGLLDAHEETAG